MKTFARILSLALVAVLLCFALIACNKPAKDPDKAVEKLTQAGYEVEMETDDGVTYVEATKGVDYVIISYFSTKSLAKAAYEEGEKDIEELKKMGEEAGIELVYGRSGKIVYCGTKAAVKAAG